MTRYDDAMVVPTGTASPWREFPYAQVDRDHVVYLRDGWTSESADLLAEALRADGVVRTLSQALRVAEEAVLTESWYGYVDEGIDEVICSAAGETEYGDIVDDVRPCLQALVNVRE